MPSAKRYGVHDDANRLHRLPHRNAPGGHRNDASVARFPSNSSCSNAAIAWRPSSTARWIAAHRRCPRWTRVTPVVLIVIVRHRCYRRHHAPLLRPQLALSSSLSTTPTLSVTALSVATTTAVAAANEATLTTTTMTTDAISRRLCSDRQPAHNRDGHDVDQADHPEIFDEVSGIETRPVQNNTSADTRTAGRQTVPDVDARIDVSFTRSRSHSCSTGNDVDIAHELLLDTPRVISSGMARPRCDDDKER